MTKGRKKLIVCKNCGKDLQLYRTYKSRAAQCDSCWNTYIHKRNQDLKRSIMLYYGGKCCCCGLDDYRFLTIDHVFNNGKEERDNLQKSKGWQLSRDYGGGGANFYRYIIKQGCPFDKYQVLCWNCNNGKAMYGKCPHILDKEKINE